MSTKYLFLCLFLVLALNVFAEETKSEPAKFELKTSAVMKDVLAENSGKKVAIRLHSGEEMEGTISTVGNSLVYLSLLTGKEFYDAVISIEQISAVRLKMRGPK